MCRLRIPIQTTRDSGCLCHSCLWFRRRLTWRPAVAFWPFRVWPPARTAPKARRCWSAVCASGGERRGSPGSWTSCHTRDTGTQLSLYGSICAEQGRRGPRTPLCTAGTQTPLKVWFPRRSAPSASSPPDPLWFSAQAPEKWSPRLQSWAFWWLWVSLRRL